MRRGVILSIMMVAVFFVTGCEQKKPEPVAPQQVVEASLSQVEQVASTTTDTATAAVESVLPDETSTENGLAMEAIDTIAESEPVETALDPEVYKTPTVQEIQTALKNAGLYDGKVDGDLGPMTDRAIRNFQSQNSLKVDGKVGPMTWAKLSGYLSSAPTTAPVVETATY